MNPQSKKKIIEQAKAARRSRKKKFAGPGSADSPENAEQAQRQGEDRFRSILSSIDDLVFVLDSDGVFIDYFQSPSAPEMYVPPKEFLGKSYKEIMPANVVELIDNAIKELAASGQSQQFEYSLQIGDKEFWFSARISMRRDVNGEIADYILVARDITERVRAEQALQRAHDELEMRVEQRTVELERANEALRAEVADRNHAEDALQAQVRRNELILRTSHDGFWIFGSDGGLRDVNDAYCRMVGYSRQELLTMNIADVEANENPQEIEAHINNIIETGYGCFETRHRRKDGSLIYLDVSTCPADLDGERFFFAFFRDITERKQAEEALQESEELHRITLSSISDAVFITDDEGAFTFICPNADVIFGYSFTEIQAFGHISKLLGSNLVDPCELQRTGEIKNIECPITDKTERAHTLLVNVKRVSIKGGTTLYTCSDITEHKRAEEALQTHMRRNELILRTTRDGFSVCGPDGDFRDVNDAYCRMVGYSREELLRMNITDVEANEKPEETRARIESIIEKGYAHFETRHHRKDGSTVYLDISTTPAELDGEWFFFAFFRDITEHKQAEQALFESEEKYRIVTETSIDTIYQLDLAGNITFMNSAGAKMYGYEPEEIIGMNFRSLMTEQRLSQGNQNVQKVLSGQTVQGELYVKHKKGHEFPIYFSMAPVVERGNVVGFAGVSRDITQRKRAEQKLLEYQAQLKSLASQLSVTEERERHRLATELHDRVGQSLVFSKMKLESLRESVSSSELAESLDEVCEFLGQTIQDAKTLMFDLSSPLLYELGFEAAVAGWLTDEIRNKHGIETVFENDGRNKPLADDIRAVLFRSVRELLFNVVKHAQAKNVKVSVRRDDGNIRVTIEDDGVGFDPGEVATNAAGRAEFGLFSIRERLGQLGGHIEIESGPGRGTKIILIAPLKQENIIDGVGV